MISLSTHTLDSSTGTHARGVTVKLFAQINDKLIELWSNLTDQGGRLKVEFDLDPGYQNCDLQLSFYTADYFLQTPKGVQTKSVCLNIRLPDPDGNYHLPIIISPHGASLWWSN